MNPPDDNLDGLRRYNLTARLLLKGAEIRVQADNRRELCILSEMLLREMYTRGLRPCIVAEGYGATNRIRTERYLGDVLRELETKL